MSLPIDRSTLLLAAGNQVPYQVASATKNINFLTVVANTIDELNAKVDTHIAAPLLPHADGSVTTAKIADGAVTASKIASLPVNIVGSSQIIDLSIQNNDIADGVLTASKFVVGSLSNDTQNALNIAALTTNVVNKRIHIDVMNPPSDTGLLPLTGLNAAQDTTRLQAIFDWIKANEYTFNVGSLYTGYTYEVEFPTMALSFTAKIILKGTYLKLIGNQTVISTNFNDYLFQTSGNNGWYFIMEGFKFPDNYKVLDLTTNNLETGYTDIHHCTFIDTVNVALNINKQSSHCYIHDNTFHQCGYALLITNTDEAFFYHNWVSEYPRSVSQDATIIHSSPLHMHSNLFVPYPSTGGATEVAFINSSASLYMIDNHFGGEPGNHAIVNCYVTADSTAPVNANQIVAKNNLTLSSAGDLTAFRFFHIPNYIHLEGNRGFTDINKLMAWGAAAVPATEIAASGGISNLRVVVKDNVGSSTNANNILTELLDATARYERTLFVSRSALLPSAGTNAYMTDLGSGNMSFNFDLGLIANSSHGSIYNLEFNTQSDVIASSTFYRGHYKGIIIITSEFSGGVLKFRVNLDQVANRGGNSGGAFTYVVTATFGTSGIATVAAAGTLDRTITITLDHAYGLPSQYGNRYRVWKTTEGLWLI